MNYCVGCFPIKLSTWSASSHCLNSDPEYINKGLTKQEDEEQVHDKYTKQTIVTRKRKKKGTQAINKI